MILRVRKMQYIIWKWRKKGLWQKRLVAPQQHPRPRQQKVRDAYFTMLSV